MAIEVRHVARILGQFRRRELTKAEAEHVLKLLDDGRAAQDTPEHRRAVADAIYRQLVHEEEADANRAEWYRRMNTMTLDELEEAET